MSRDYPTPTGGLDRVLNPTLEGVTVSLPRTEYRRGDSVVPTVSVTSGAENLVVGLVCFERWLDTSGESGPSPSRATEWKSWRPLAEGPPSFAVPPSAPYSYEGKLLTLSWAVVVKESRRLRPDRTLRTPVWVSP